MNDCVFCDLDTNVPTASLYFSNPNVYRFEPLNPVVPGHMLFVPHAHFAHAAEKPYEAGRVFAAAASWANHKDVAYNLITSGGKEATQSIFHLHVHYVPRAEGDGLHLPWTGQQKPSDIICTNCGKDWDTGPLNRCKNCAADSSHAQRREAVTGD